MQIKFLMVVMGGVGIVYGASMADRSMNYTEVTGTIKSASHDCFVENSKGKLVEKGSDKKAYMDCDIAPMIAVQFGYSESDVKQRTKFTYQYTSPVDGVMHEDSAQRDGKVGSYQEGTTLTVYAHNTEADKTRLH